MEGRKERGRKISLASMFIYIEFHVKLKVEKRLFYIKLSPCFLHLILQALKWLIKT